MELKQAIKHRITIDPSHNGGFIVTIGYARMVYANSEDIILDLKEFFLQPEKAEVEYDFFRECKSLKPELNIIWPKQKTNVFSDPMC